MQPNWKQYEHIKPSLDRNYANHQRLRPIAPTHSRFSQRKLSSLWHRFCHFSLNLFSPMREPIITEKFDRNGIKRWHIYDPVTDQTIILDSPKEVLAWLDDRYNPDKRADGSRMWK
jgi:hypothetical protein